MVSTIKTLIIFDTNALRHVLRINKNGNPRDVVYHTFEFGAPYRIIESFITDNGLDDFVQLAIPRIVLDEIKRQKSRSYTSDLSSFSEIYALLSKMPYQNKEKLALPDSSFDYQAHVEKISEEYLNTKKIRIIEIPDDEHLKAVFDRIISRALNTQPPFKQHGDVSDAGFKDALIWESILSCSSINDFDKVILLSNDNGFDGCKDEFQQIINKYFSIQKSDWAVTDELAKDYADYIEKRDYINFAKTDYFKSHLEGALQGKSVLIDEQAYVITRVEIVDPCASIETIQDSEMDEEININSKIKAFFLKNNAESEVPFTVSTIIDEAKNILDARFDKELID